MNNAGSYIIDGREEFNLIIHIYQKWIISLHIFLNKYFSLWARAKYISSSEMTSGEWLHRTFSFRPNRFIRSANTKRIIPSRVINPFRPPHVVVAASSYPDTPIKKDCARNGRERYNPSVSSLVKERNSRVISAHTILRVTPIRGEDLVAPTSRSPLMYI